MQFNPVYAYVNSLYEISSVVFATVSKSLHTITMVSSDHVFVVVRYKNKHKANMLLYLSPLFIYLGIYI
jgi:hypothetical protein